MTEIIIAIISGLCVAVPSIIATISEAYETEKTLKKAYYLKLLEE